MKIITKVSQMQKIALGLRFRNKKIGLVPTMGALHAAHASLIQKARKENDTVIVSIFVNPAQFGPKEDYLKYPRPFEKDINTCRLNGTDFVFAPPVKEMYPGKYLTFIKVEELSGILCGKFRKLHFRGVTTVVAKLFNITQPVNAYFGEKDFQQLTIIKKMAQDLNFPVHIVACPTIREPGGLALSSRNAYLDSKEKQNAYLIYRTLNETKKEIQTNKIKSAQKAANELRKKLNKIPHSKIEYVKICGNSELDEFKSTVKLPARIIVALWIGKTRLIDNIEL